MNNLKIRLATDKDILGLSIFFKNLSRDSKKMFHPHSFNVDSIRKIFRHKNDIRLLLLDNNKNIVGYAFVSRLLIFSDIGYLGIGLSDDYQGKGLGKTLMNRLLILSKKRGIRKIILDVYSNNKKAIGLYLKMGFKVIDASFILQYLIALSEKIKDFSFKVVAKKNTTRYKSVWMSKG